MKIVLIASSATVENEKKTPWNSRTTDIISTLPDMEYRYMQMAVAVPETAMIPFLLLRSLKIPAKGRVNSAARDIRPEMVAAAATVAPTLMAYLETIGVIIWEEAWLTMLSRRIVTYPLFHSFSGS